MSIISPQSGKYFPPIFFIYFSKPTQMPNQNEEVNEMSPVKVLKKALADADFQNTDIGGAMFSLMDSIESDLIEVGVEYSDTTEALKQNLIDILAEDINAHASSDEDDEVEDEGVVEEEDDEEEDDEEDDEDSAILQSIREGDVDDEENREGDKIAPTTGNPG